MATLVALGALLAGPVAHLLEPVEDGHHHGLASQLTSQLVLGAHHDHDGPHAEAELVPVAPHRHDPCGSCLRTLREVSESASETLLAGVSGPGAVASAVDRVFASGAPSRAARPRGPPIV